MEQLLTEEFLRGYYESIKEVIEAIETGELTEENKEHFEDVYDFINSVFLDVDKRHLVMTTGGPHVEVCFNCGVIAAYWGSESRRWHLNSDEVETLADFFEEVTA